MDKPKLIAVVGPTAIGKSDLGVELALKHDGEIISADSRQVYIDLNIGTGKITEEEKRGVPHHLLDIISPEHQLTVVEYKKLADKAIEDIISRNKLPILVGGTGLYIEAVVDDVVYPEVPPNPPLREKLEEKTNEELNALLTEKDPRRARAINQHDRVRIIRALEITEHLGAVPEQPITESSSKTLLIGLDLPKEEVNERIEKRLLKRLDEGMLDEIQTLHKNGLSWERMEALGLEYRYGARYLQNFISKDEFIETLITRIRQYAKRQRTWFKRDKRIKWFEPDEKEKIEQVVRSFLS